MFFHEGPCRMLSRRRLTSVITAEINVNITKNDMKYSLISSLKCRVSTTELREMFESFDLRNVPSSTQAWLQPLTLCK